MADDEQIVTEREQRLEAALRMLLDRFEWHTTCHCSITNNYTCVRCERIADARKALEGK